MALSSSPGWTEPTPSPICGIPPFFAHILPPFCQNPFNQALAHDQDTPPKTPAPEIRSGGVCEQHLTIVLDRTITS